MKKIIKTRNSIQFKMHLEADFVILCTVSITEKESKSGQFSITVASKSPSLAGVICYDKIATTCFSFTEFRNDYDSPTFEGEWWQSLVDMHDQKITSNPNEWRSRIVDHVDQSIFEAVQLMCSMREVA